ncbi:serine hydrolase [Lactococcus kimchii]|uniref:serine hydrolase n=1 Tax=Lactococcus sp. S-13 TaxID=2507158 RepID=UPI00102388F0|nr:serine hydrolase [Lactococcus sp. S-13]RZI49436.1 serine hydrolase [Lactococcus sp. S-13]
MQKLRNKFNIGVGLVMLLMLIPSFFAFPKFQKNTEKQSSKHGNVVVADKLVENKLWTSLPERAVAYKDLQTYSDAELTKVNGNIPQKTQLDITEVTGKAFKLKNGNYISADKKDVISDVPLSREPKQQTLYTNKSVNVFYNPVTTYDNQVLSVLKGNQELLSDKIAQTYWGKYYEISLSNGQKGWISEKDISLENPKLQQVQALLNEKYNNKKYSIYVKQIDNDFTAGINQNEKMYSASLSKLPILYWTQKQLNDGKASLNDQLLYTTSINTFYGSYQPEGTGNLPKTADNKSYSLQDIINRTAKLSDNVGSNMLAYYETQQFSATYQNEITQIAGSPWNPKERQASAQMVGKVLEALYNEGGAAFNALFNTSFDDVKIRAAIPQNVPVAHKIGGADNDNHDAAIIFTSEPYLLVIETQGATDEQIQKISQDIYGVMK